MNGMILMLFEWNSLLILEYKKNKTIHCPFTINCFTFALSEAFWSSIIGTQHLRQTIRFETIRMKNSEEHYRNHWSKKVTRIVTMIYNKEKKKRETYRETERNWTRLVFKAFLRRKKKKKKFWCQLLLTFALCASYSFRFDQLNRFGARISIRPSMLPNVMQSIKLDRSPSIMEGFYSLMVCFDDWIQKISMRYERRAWNQ